MSERFPLVKQVMQLFLAQPEPPSQEEVDAMKKLLGDYSNLPFVKSRMHLGDSRVAEEATSEASTSERSESAANEVDEAGSVTKRFRNEDGSAVSVKRFEDMAYKELESLEEHISQQVAELSKNRLALVNNINQLERAPLQPVVLFKRKDELAALDKVYDSLCTEQTRLLLLLVEKEAEKREEEQATKSGEKRNHPGY